MRRLVSSAHHAFALLHNLGPRKFYMVLIFWILRRHRRAIAPALNFLNPKSPKEKISTDPVLVYQMAKVGSTSLMYSLQHAYVKAGLADVNLHHVHTLINLDAHEQLARNSHKPTELAAAVNEYKKIRADFDANPSEHWNAVTMVRDPIARHVSDYFHHLDRHIPNWRSLWQQGTLTIDELQQNFLAATDHADQWFDSEIKSVLGIDVFAEPFPHAAGYAYYSRPPKVSLILIRLEDMNRVVSQAVAQLPGFQNFTLHSFNSGSETTYSNLYKQFKAKPLPTWYVEKAYSTRLAAHFYTQAEREEFATRWACPQSFSLPKTLWVDR